MPRIVTYNIHHACGVDGVVSLRRVAETLVDINPDLVALQEVDRFRRRSGFAYQAPRLARTLKNHWCYGINRRYFFIGAYGNAVLSRYPIKRRGNFALPSSEEQRGLLATEIEIDGRALWFGCTHLGLDQAERASHIHCIEAYLDTVSHPVVLAGDFNCSPTATELKPLFGVLNNTIADPTAEPTYPSAQPRVRLDNIFVSPAIKIRSAQACYSAASDHLPFYADIELE